MPVPLLSLLHSPRTVHEKHAGVHTVVPRTTVDRQPPQVAPSWLSPVDARSRPALPAAAPLPSPPSPSLLSSLSPPSPPLWPGAGGDSLPLGRGFRPRLVEAPLPVGIARDPLPDPCGRPRLPLVAGAPSSAPVGLDAVAPGVAVTALDCVRGIPERPAGVTSLFPSFWWSSAARPAASPGSICPVACRWRLPRCRKRRQRGTCTQGALDPEDPPIQVSLPLRVAAQQVLLDVRSNPAVR